MTMKGERARTPPTERQIKAAVERYEEGIDLVAEIANDYGVNPATVTQWAKRAGVKRFMWTRRRRNKDARHPV